MTRELLRECKKFIDERLIYPIGHDTATDLLDRIDAALASPEPEPVAWLEVSKEGPVGACLESDPTSPCKWVPLYTSALCGRQGWISVEDRLPDERVYVLGYWRGNHHGGESEFTVTFYDDGKWLNPEDVNEAWWAPSHWLPIPLPPTPIVRDEEG